MDKNKNIKIGTIHPGDVKVRKKSPPPTQVQHSSKDDDRKRLKEETRKDANVHEVPGIDSDTALAFYLAEKYLEPLLPRTTVKRLESHFRRAEEVLDQADADKGNPAWRNKVRVLHRGPGLKSPAIKSDIQSAIYDALLRNRRLDVAYLPRGKIRSNSMNSIRSVWF